MTQPVPEHVLRQLRTVFARRITRFPASERKRLFGAPALHVDAWLDDFGAYVAAGSKDYHREIRKRLERYGKAFPGLLGRGHPLLDVTGKLATFSKMTLEALDPPVMRVAPSADAVMFDVGIRWQQSPQHPPQRYTVDWLHVSGYTDLADLLLTLPDTLDQALVRHIEVINPAQAPYVA